MRYYYSLEYMQNSGNSRTAQESSRLFSQFMNGDVPEKILNNFTRLVSRMSCGQPENWQICFVPASSEAETINRFSALAARLSEATGVRSNLTSISRKGGSTLFDAPEFSCDSSAISGINVILVDSLVSRGRTINAAASALISAGALSVTGLVAAKDVTEPHFAA